MKSLKISSELPIAADVALIHAAERLFARHGIEAVSLRQVNSEAKQKNIAAAHYYFGSKDGLVVAVLQHRWPRLDEKRRVLFQRTQQQKDLKSCLECIILPLAEELAPRPEGNSYVRFIQHYERYSGNYDLAQQLSPTGVEIYRCIEKLLHHLPKKIRAMRMEYFISIIQSVLATAEHKLEKGELSYRDVPMIASNLIEMVTGALNAG